MSNSYTANIRHKNQAEVSVRMVGEEPFEAIVFLAVGDRLIDLLNDERCFIPVRREDGETIIVAKTQIVSIIETGGVIDLEEEAISEDEVPGEASAGDKDLNCEENTDAEPDEDVEKSEAKTAQANRPRFDAHAVLRVAPHATVSEIRSAYKTRVKAVHPDSIASLGLDEDLIEAALKTTQKVNYAYRKIMREREELSRLADAEDADAAGEADLEPDAGEPEAKSA